jgi:hypothetical protein
MSTLEPLPDDLRALLEAERDAYPERRAMAARVHQAIEASFGAVALATATGASMSTATTATAGATAAPAAPPLASAAAAPAKAAGVAAALTSAKAATIVGLLTFAAGITVGEFHGRSAAESARAEGSATAAVRAPMPPPVLEVKPSVPEGAELGVDVHSLPVSPNPASQPALSAPKAQPEVPHGASDLPEEQALIDTARAALARGRPADALQATEAQARKFPNGKLSEERESIAIQALSLLGRNAEAALRFERFRKRFPHSLYAASLAGLLGASSTKPPATDAGGAGER